MIPQLERIFLAMGAESFHIPAPVGPMFPFVATTSVPEGVKQGTLQRGALRAMPNPVGGLVNHQMGTMRMGTDPDTSVVNQWQAFHGIPNLYVTDASVFPTSGGYNPTLTIQALAWRAAQHIIDNPP